MLPRAPSSLVVGVLPSVAAIHWTPSRCWPTRLQFGAAELEGYNLQLNCTLQVSLMLHA